MKKFLILFTFILCCSLTGCGNKDREIKTDIERQLESIKAGSEDLSDFDIYERINLQDSKLNIEDIENTNINKIFNSMEWSIKDIQANNSTALATLEITSKDIDAILSKDYVMTQLILDYAKYIRSNPNAEREELDRYIIDQISQVIQFGTEFTTNEVIVNVYLSGQTNNWSIAYDDNFLGALLGVMEKEYLIDINDICEEAVKNVDIRYDYNKILNLPDSNKTTRSSIKSPIKFNEEAYFDNSDYFYQKEKYELKMKLVEIVRGSKAKELIEESAGENVSMRMLDTNSEYILFKLNIELVNNMTTEKTVEIQPLDFSLLDSNGHFYDNCITFGIDEFSPIEEGQSTDGWVCFLIDRGTTPFLLFKDYMDNTLVFSN